MAQLPPPKKSLPRPLTTPTRVALPPADVRAPTGVTPLTTFPPRVVVPAVAAAEPPSLRMSELTKISTTLSRLNRARRASHRMTLGGRGGIGLGGAKLAPGTPTARGKGGPRREGGRYILGEGRETAEQTLSFVRVLSRYL